MTATGRARAMLAKATLKRECDDTIRREGCKSCDAWWPITTPARRAIERLGFTPATLAVAITLAEALIRFDDLIYDYRQAHESDDEGYEEREGRMFAKLTTEAPEAQKARADFEALLPEEEK